jgi:hypothetical protein
LYHLNFEGLTAGFIDVRDNDQDMGFKAGRDKKAALDLSQRWRAAFICQN